MSNYGKEIWKSLRYLIGYIKGKNTEGTIVRNPKILKAVMFCEYKYTMNKETRKSISGLFATLGETLLTCSSKIQKNITLISTEAKYIS